MLSFEKTLLAFFTLLLTIIILLGIVWHHYDNAFKEASRSIKYTQLILQKTEYLGSLCKNIQVESSGYAITGNAAFLNAYNDLKKGIPDNIKHFRKLNFSGNGQIERVDSLTMLINELIEFSDMNIKLREENQFSNNALTTKILTGKDFLNRIGSIVNKIKEEESKQLAIRETRYKENTASSNGIFFIFLFLILVLPAAALISIAVSFKKRKAAEEKERSSKEQLRSLINNVKDYAICMLDSEGRILEWNEGAQNIYQYSESEVLGKKIDFLYTYDDQKAGIPDYNLNKAAAEGRYETEGFRVNKAGNCFWADAYITGIYHPDGKIKGFTKVSRDFTVRKKLEEETEKALQKEKELNELKSSFVSMASHEFRTPLSSILFSASLIGKYSEPGQQEKREKHIEKIKSNVWTLSGILEEFLSIEKIEKGKITAKLEKCDCTQLIQMICNEMKGIAKTGQKIIYTNQNKDEIVTDPILFKQVLVNLLSNAIKYSPENSIVTVNTYSENSLIYISVKDEGIGISNEDQKHLFERFFRASNSGGIEGTGLGLHLVRQYLNLLNGSIRISSKEGEGTEFTVSFPLQTG